MKYITHAPYLAENKNGHFIVIDTGSDEYLRIWDNERFGDTEVYKWCLENFHEVRKVIVDCKIEEYKFPTWETIHDFEHWTWRFESKEDAMAFKLRWE